MSQEFDTSDRVRLEVEAPVEGLPNLVQNPSGALGGWGWVTPVPGSVMYQGNPGTGVTIAYKHGPTAGVGGYFATELMRVAAGRWVGARLDAVVNSTGHVIRARIEWYNAAGVWIGQAAQSADSTFNATLFTPIAQAPAGTASARLRVDMYGPSASTPSANATADLRRVMVTHAATSAALSSRTHTNLLANGSFDESVAGWYGWPENRYGRKTNAPQEGAGYLFLEAFTYDPSTMVGAQTGCAVTGGKDYTLSGWLFGETLGGIRVWAKWHVGSGFVEQTITEPSLDGFWRRWSRTLTAPAGAFFLTLVIENEWNPGGVTTAMGVDSVMVEEGRTLTPFHPGTISISGFGYTEPQTWRNVLGPALHVTITREALNLGVLSATVADVALDPATSPLIRPGRAVRLMALTSTGEWQPLFVGELVKAEVAYYLKDPSIPESKRAQITLEAVDGLKTLANAQRPQGVGTVDELPWVLEGCGIPWNVNGSGDQVASATVVATNENATAGDQVAVTRDSVLAEAWMDRFGVLQVVDRAKLSITRKATLTESHYSELGVSWSASDAINEVNVRLRRPNLATGETVEIARGPYRDENSIAEWGALATTVTVHGIPDTEAAALAYAQKILLANGTPARRVETVTVPIASESQFATDAHNSVFRDLVDLVRVSNTSLGLNTNLRVRTIEHSITPEKWLVKLGFGAAGSVAVPTMAPPLPGVSTPDRIASAVGNTAVTTNAAGVASIPHGLGRMAVMGLAEPQTTAYRAAVTAYSATHLTVNVVNAAGAAFAGTISLQWFAA